MKSWFSFLLHWLTPLFYSLDWFIFIIVCSYCVKDDHLFNLFSPLLMHCILKIKINPFAMASCFLSQLFCMASQNVSFLSSLESCTQLDLPFPSQDNYIQMSKPASLHLFQPFSSTQMSCLILSQDVEQRRLEPWEKMYFIQMNWLL